MPNCTDDQESVFDAAYRLVQSLPVSQPVIVDAGAYVGNTTKAFLDQYPSSTIHAIEPVPEHVEQLESAFRNEDNVLIHDVAIGDTRESVRFNVVKKSDTSSVFKPSDTKFELRDKLNKADAYQVEDVIEVPQLRLDAIVDDPDLMKLDLQGGELKALHGMGDIESVEIIIAETMFIPLYDDQPLFCDIDNYLSERGFHLYGLYGLKTEATGQLSQANALFLHERHLNEHLVLEDSIH